MTKDIREIRRRAHLSQQQLAERSGVAQPNIAAYETGRRIPSEAMVNRLTLAARPLPHEALAAHRSELLGLAESFGLTNLRVFGSVARGNDGPGSDLDLLATRAPDVGLLSIAMFSEEASKLLGVEVDVVTDGGLSSDHEIMRTAVLA